MITKASSSSTASFRRPCWRALCRCLGLADPVIEVKLTPNRPDCTGVRGIARDLAAAGLGKLKPEPKFAGVEGDSTSPVAIKLEFTPETATPAPSSPAATSRASKTARRRRGCRQRLKAVGLRPINALVDVTNYISHRPRPSAARLRCRQAQRRRARAARQDGREVRRARRQGPRRRRDHVRHRRRQRPSRLRRHYRRRGLRLHATTTKNVLIEMRLLRPACVRRPRAAKPASRRCALPLRARRRPGLRPPGPRSGHRHDSGDCRRQALEGVSRRQGAARAARHRLRHGPYREADAA